MLIFLLLLLTIYFFIMGLLTMFESKILGFIQNSVSVFKFNFLGIYNFYLDFLKVLPKGFFSGKNKKLAYYYLNLILMMLLMAMNFLVVVFSFLFSKEIYFYSLVMFLMMDSSVLVLKMILLSWFKSKFVKLGVYSIKELYVLIEGMFSYMVLLVGAMNMNFSGGKEEVISTMFLFLLTSFFLVKMFSIPFDYFESESELVGGATLEFQSMGFLLWSLLEYGLIFNNILFLVFMFNLFFNVGLVINIFGVSLSMIVVLIISGVLVSVSFYTTIYFSFYMFFMINTIIFLILLV